MFNFPTFWGKTIEVNAILLFFLYYFIKISNIRPRCYSWWWRFYRGSL